jgi:hypothetical protein
MRILGLSWQIVYNEDFRNPASPQLHVHRTSGTGAHITSQRTRPKSQWLDVKDGQRSIFPCRKVLYRTAALGARVRRIDYRQDAQIVSTVSSRTMHGMHLHQSF